MKDNNAEPTRTIVRGNAKAISAIRSGIGPVSGNPWSNFLARTEDGNILRMQFWGHLPSDFKGFFPGGDPKNSYFEFEGQLRGTYDEKPSIALSMEGMRLLEIEE